MPDICFRRRRTVCQGQADHRRRSGPRHAVSLLYQGTHEGGVKARRLAGGIDGGYLVAAERRAEAV